MNLARFSAGIGSVAAAMFMVGCDPVGEKTAPLDAALWNSSKWIAASDSAVADEATIKKQNSAPGTSWFVAALTNKADVASVKWMSTALGVYDIYINGNVIGKEVLKPGYTHVKKTRRAFTYDLGKVANMKSGEINFFAAEVSAGWWRDQIVRYAGKKSAFRCVVEVVYKDGKKEILGSDTVSWKAGVTGPVLRAGIFDGEYYDARIAKPLFGSDKLSAPVLSDEFNGEILNSDGGEVYRRDDLTLKPVSAYCWMSVEGAANLDAKDSRSIVYGKVVKTATFDNPKNLIKVKKGEKLVLDYGQNCAGVPLLAVRAPVDTHITMLPAEMLNDSNGERSRGNDGPAGSIYRENLRIPKTGMVAEYICSGRGDKDGIEVYSPRFTFFGYRYLQVTASCDAELYVISVPITSIAKEMEIGSIATGDKDVNKLISNVYWGQLSNYLSVPTDCPQRNERLGWMADTQVFVEAGAFNADTSKFFHKFMRDVIDNSDEHGGFSDVAPYGQYGNGTCNLGWADAGVIIPWTIWKQFGDIAIIEQSYDAMAKFVRHIDSKKYDFEDGRYIYADWLSYQKFETSGNKYGGWAPWDAKTDKTKKAWKNDPDAKNYRLFLAACYWVYDAQIMQQVATCLGKSEDVKEFAAIERRARKHIEDNFIDKEDKLLLKPMRELQTACIFALKFDIVKGEAFKATKAILLNSIKEHGDCLQTGFLGTSFIMDTLTKIGANDVAYTLLLQHKNPSWLYSVDQGATTIWERWNSYCKDVGFGPVGMNSFNHYAYGAVLAWIYKTAAGIAADPAAPGFSRIIMAPKPDRRLGHLEAKYKSPKGVIESKWRYTDTMWEWDFVIPEGASALVTLPTGGDAVEYPAGKHSIKLPLK